MKIQCTCTGSTSLIRGPRLAFKAGLFCLPAKGVFIPISGGLPLPSAKKRTARESGLVDSGIWRAAFLFVENVNKSHYVHRNHSTATPANAGRPIPRHASEVPVRLYVARQRRLRLCGGAPCPPERATLRQNRKPEIFHAFNPVGHVHRNFTHRNPPAIPASGRQNGCRRPENPARIVAQPAQNQYLRAFRAARFRGQSFNVASQFFTHLFLTAA